MPASAPTRYAGEPTDSDLVARVRAGEDRAFELLYARYHRRIAAYIYGMVKDYGRAEDVAQDVFMSALRRMRETDRPIAFKPWLYEIAKNACIDQFRRSQRTEEVSYDADGGLGAADAGRLVALRPSPDAALDQKLSLDHLRGAFSGLSQTHHEILVMRELEGLSYREIGERLGMSRPAVESTLFRARRRLAEEYAELISGERCRRVQAIMDLAAERALGARDQRRLAAHVSHCQGCRRHARAAGIDERLLAARPLRAKIAALLPLPAFLRRRLDGDGAPPPSAVHQVAQWSTQLGALGDPGMSSWFKAVAAAATVAMAGLGASAATQHAGDSAGGTRLAPAPVQHAREAAAPARRAAGASGRRGALLAGGSATAAGTPIAVRQGGRGHAPARSGGATVSGGGSGTGMHGSTDGGAGGAGGTVLPAHPTQPVTQIIESQPGGESARKLWKRSKGHVVRDLRRGLGLPGVRGTVRDVQAAAGKVKDRAAQGAATAGATVQDAAEGAQDAASQLLGGG